MFALPVARYESLAWLERFRDRVDQSVRDETLARFLPEFRTRLEQRRRLQPPDLRARAGEGDEMLRALQRDGYALGALAEDHRLQIRELALPIAVRMHAALDKIDEPRFSDGQIQLDRAEHAALFAAVARGLAACGAQGLLSVYSGRWLVLRGVTLQVNTAKETLAKYGELDTSGRPELATRYFHVDSNDWPCVKVLIYLTDVGPEQGPFRYVAGSNRLMGPFEAAVRKTNDKLRHSARHLCALPAPFAQHANFGDYVDPASPSAQRLLQKEMVVCDGRSDLVLFDNNGVHRGGMVRDGHRYMLQCMFARRRRLSGR